MDTAFWVGTPSTPWCMFCNESQCRAVLFAFHKEQSGDGALAQCRQKGLPLLVHGQIYYFWASKGRPFTTVLTALGTTLFREKVCNYDRSVFFADFHLGTIKLVDIPKSNVDDMRLHTQCSVSHFLKIRPRNVVTIFWNHARLFKAEKYQCYEKSFVQAVLHM